MEIVSARSKEHFSIASWLHAESWRHAYRGMISDDYLNSLKDDFWTSNLERLSNLGVLDVDILFDNCNLVGVVSYGRARDENFRDWGEIVSLYIRPECFRKGFGNILLKHSVNEFKSKGFEHCYLWVLKENDIAKAFYLKNQFSWNGEECKINLRGQTLTDLRYVRAI